MRLVIRRPDDWHVHLRDEPMLAEVLDYTARQFARAIVMPNLDPPVTTMAEAVAYRLRIQRQVRVGRSFAPLMTAYLTDSTDAGDLAAGFEQGVFTAAKWYPAHATTNSAKGVTEVGRIHGVLETMQRIGMPLLVHGEVTNPEVDIFDREAVFVERILAPVVRDFPGLKVVCEHITTEEAAGFVLGSSAAVAATITPHHLQCNRNALFQGGIRPHLYCLPVLKREKHRLALRKAATSGSPKFSRDRFRAARGGRQGVGLRVRRGVQRTGGARGLRHRLRGGERPRPVRGLCFRARSQVLRLAAERRPRYPDSSAKSGARADPVEYHHDHPLSRRYDAGVAVRGMTVHLTGVRCGVSSRPTPAPTQ